VSNLVAFPDYRRAREDASAWLARIDRGLGSDERNELRRWLGDTTHHRALLDMARLWRGMDAMAVLSELFPLNQSGLTTRRPGLPVMALAAAVAIGIVTLGTVFLAGRPWWVLFETPAPVPNTVAMNERYSTEVGETRAVTLRDGSVITLNTNSLISVIYSPHERDVYLVRGEANFEVAHDVARPFNVYAGKRVLQAVGTAFNVRLLSADDVELTVTEGKVKVLPDGRDDSGAAGGRSGDISVVETTVTAQETAIVQPEVETVRRLAPAEMDARLAWQRGMLIFNGETLEVVLAEIDRYTNTEFLLADDSLRTVRVGGYFRAGDIDGLLIALRENFNIDSRRDEKNRIILSAATPHS
jgi:transmembrane sensor